MPKIGIQNFCLPARKTSSLNAGLLLPRHMLEELKSIATPKVVNMTLRAVERAELYDSRHPFWNAIADTYIGILKRYALLRETFPDIIRAVHNSEIKKGDIVVSDYYSGLNFGQVSGGFEPAKICVCDTTEDILVGKLFFQEGGSGRETAVFKNEIWYLISHKFTVISNKHLLH